MASTSQRQKGRDRALSALDAVIQALSIAKDSCGIPPAQAVFGIASALLTMIRVSLANKQEYVDFGLACGEIFTILDRALKGRRLDELSSSVLAAIEQLTTTVAGIQREVIELGQRNAASKVFHSNNDKDKIAGWKQELARILQVFDTELAINTLVFVADTYGLVVDIHRSIVAGREGAISHHQSTQASVPVGELPPPPPAACFGRNELIEGIVDFAENFESLALIGAGGIGKTSVALAVLHHDRVKDRFGDNRRFIRCDEFPASCTHFLARLSQVVGAGVKNPEDLTPLRPFLSSRDMIVFLDNAESILDPQGTDSQEIYAVVEELGRFENICLGVTSRITTVPPHFKRPTVPTLSIESACDIFYAIYSNGGRSDTISNLVKRLDFHALSITLLATTASHNVWDHDRLAKEWETHRVQVLRTHHNKSLAATVELSLSSPTFRRLTPPPKFHKFLTSPTFSKFIPSPILRKIPPSARELLEVVAFFPQGIDEKNLDWLFPTIPDRKNIFDKFCVLSLTHRNSGFITMLAPIRDYLRPRDPKSSPLLCATKGLYFTRLSVDVNPSVNVPGFKEAEWIKSEDVNVEHLLDVFTSIDPNAHNVWDVCSHFMQHLRWHKPRQTVLKSKIEGLPNSHRSKAICLFELAELFGSVGNCVEDKRLLSDALALEREKGNDFRVAVTLRFLSDVNRMLGLYREGIQQAEEALEIYKQLGNKMGQADCLGDLAWLLLDDGQLDTAENAALHMIDLLPEKGQDFSFCRSHRVLGNIYCSKGEKEKAIDHFETALRIASRFNFQDILFWAHYSMAGLFLTEDGFDNANTHIEQAKSHVVDDEYLLGRAMDLQARIWYSQSRQEDARSEALRALEIFEKLGAALGAGDCRDLLQAIERAMESQSVSGESVSDA